MREASARVACQNNLKQLALGVHNSADSTGGLLPAGTVACQGLPVEGRLSWMVELLPYVEQDQLARRFDPTVGWGGVNEEPARTGLRVYRCPSWNPGGATDWEWKTNYVGVAGVGPDAAELPITHPRAGVWGYDRRTPIAVITDGMSSTLLLVETTRDPGPWAQGGPGTVRGADTADRPYVGTGRAFGSNHFPNKTLFGHDKSVPSVAAMTDGSARLLAPHIAPDVFEALATIAGGEPLPADW